MAAVESLLKHDHPVVVNEKATKKPPKVIFLPSPPPTKEKSAPKKDIKQDILNTIFPPKYWAEEKEIWMQRVSSAPSTRADVIHLKEMLDAKLQQRHAGQMGICPIRSELYSQCFDELIRQMAINCSERGLLLFRIRDEIQTTVATYRTLYESSVAFGMRKRLLTEKVKADMEKRICDLEEENEELKKTLTEKRAANHAGEKREIERQQQEEGMRCEEIQALKRSKQQLMDQLLETIETTKK